MLEKKEKTNRLENLSHAEQISVHINNLISTFGEKTVKETLTLFGIKDIVKRKKGVKNEI